MASEGLLELWVLSRGQGKSWVGMTFGLWFVFWQDWHQPVSAAVSKVTENGGLSGSRQKEVIDRAVGKKQLMDPPIIMSPRRLSWWQCPSVTWRDSRAERETAWRSDHEELVGSAISTSDVRGILRLVFHPSDLSSLKKSADWTWMMLYGPHGEFHFLTMSCCVNPRICCL